MKHITPAQIRHLWSYYKVGVANTIFGLSLYSLLVFIGLNLFLAQFIGQCIGMVFNYQMFRRFVFREGRPSIPRYIAAYGFNYIVGATLLFFIHKIVSSAYLAGICTAAAASIINYVILRFLVFTRKGRG